MDYVGLPPKTLKLEKLFVPVPSTGMSSPFRGAANGTSRSEAGLDRAKQAFEQEKARKAAVPSLGRCVSDESIGKTCSSHVSSHHWFQVRILNPFSQSTFGTSIARNYHPRWLSCIYFIPFSFICDSWTWSNIDRKAIFSMVKQNERQNQAPIHFFPINFVDVPPYVFAALMFCFPKPPVNPAPKSL